MFPCSTVCQPARRPTRGSLVQGGPAAFNWSACVFEWTGTWFAAIIKAHRLAVLGGSADVDRAGTCCGIWLLSRSIRRAVAARSRRVDLIPVLVDEVLVGRRVDVLSERPLHECRDLDGWTVGVAGNVVHPADAVSTLLDSPCDRGVPRCRRNRAQSRPAPGSPRSARPSDHRRHLCADPLPSTSSTSFCVAVLGFPSALRSRLGFGVLHRVDLRQRERPPTGRGPCSRLLLSRSPLIGPRRTGSGQRAATLPLVAREFVESRRIWCSTVLKASVSSTLPR
ncbi:hypothetical protein DFR71_2143 [Nocardia alba]|uniref:Uncharacterized protein n=1 Tax=Nocardia alba TaxID=225051 RepID=A0A4R1G6G3_9NOCA|nr:hypothetical protein DFR71_2143 [Nocardia alba]